MAPSNPTIIPLKPSRPFTEYHIFFQLERNYILQTSDKSSHIDTTIDFGDIDPDASTRPPRYRSLTLPKQWYTKGSRPKRRGHRKTHGKISFVELTKLISQRWREADQVTKVYCRDLAQGGLKRYKEDIKEYVERYGEDALQSTKKKAKEKRDEKGKQDTKQDELVQENIKDQIRRESTQKALGQSLGISSHNNQKIIHTPTPTILPEVMGETMMYHYYYHYYLQGLVHRRPDAIRPPDEAVRRPPNKINDFRREIEDSAMAIMASKSSSVSLGKSTEKDEIAITDEDDESDEAAGKAASADVSPPGPVFAQGEDKPPGQDCCRLSLLSEVASYLHNSPE